MPRARSAEVWVPPACDDHGGTLAQLITLPDLAITELASALSDSAQLNVRDADATTASISDKVPSVPAKDLRRLMATLLALSSVAATSDVSTDKFVADIIRAIKRSRRSDLSMDDHAIDRTRNRLKHICVLYGADGKETSQAGTLADFKFITRIDPVVALRQE